MLDEESNNKKVDVNGMIQIDGNPISKVGVFEYAGFQIDPMKLDSSIDQDAIYKVYRPEEELSSPECIESFKLLPWTDEHYAMIGVDSPGLRDVGETGVQGVIGEDIYFEDGYLKANIKVFTQKLANLIKKGKKELSIGYNCLYDKVNGAWNGLNYHFIQREIRGNHVASVDEGRSGPDVAVLDSKNTKQVFTLTIDTTRLQVEENKEKEGGDMVVTSDEEELIDQVAPQLDEEEIKKGLSLEMLSSQIAELAAKISAMASSKEEVSEGMDEEEIKKENAAMDSKISKVSAELAKFKKDAIKGIFEEVSNRDALASKLSDHVGSFDSSKMTAQEVAEYGVKSLKLPAQKGSEITAVDVYLSTKAASKSSSFAVDAKIVSKCDQIEKYIRGEE